MQRTNSYLKKLKTDRPITGFLSKNISTALTPHCRSSIVKKVNPATVKNKENISHFSNNMINHEKQKKQYEIPNSDQLKNNETCINHKGKSATFYKS